MRLGSTPVRLRDAESKPLDTPSCSLPISQLSPSCFGLYGRRTPGRGLSPASVSMVSWVSPLWHVRVGAQRRKRPRRPISTLIRCSSPPWVWRQPPARVLTARRVQPRTSTRDSRKVGHLMATLWTTCDSDRTPVSARAGNCSGSRPPKPAKAARQNRRN